MSITSLLALLGRPQFTKLKFLRLPLRVKLGKSSMKAIVNACPCLETWDVGYSQGSKRGTDNDLIEAAESFVNLTSIRTDMWHATSYGIAHAAKAMGVQLLDLRISNDCIYQHTSRMLCSSSFPSFIPTLSTLRISLPHGIATRRSVIC
jgi:hypothetical protein